MVPVGALLIIEPLPSSNPAAVQLNIPVLTTCAPLLRVGVPLKVPPLNCTRLVTMLPPLHVNAPLTITGLVPARVPLLWFSAGITRLPLSLKLTVPPEMFTVALLMVETAAKLATAPEQTHVPKPVIVVLLFSEKVPPPN